MLDSPNPVFSGPNSRSTDGSGHGHGAGSGSNSKQSLAASDALGMLKFSNHSPSLKQAKGVMDLPKPDLLRLLGLLEAELQARDLVITSLKNERSKLLKPSKNHHRHYTLSNPYTALVRDNEKGPAAQPGDSDEEKAKAPDSKDVVASLHAVIEHHRKAEDRVRVQLHTLRESHAKAVSELEEEKKKHAQDTAQGDDVTYMLEKERERLMQQVDFEKAQQRKVEREWKRAQGRLLQERKRHEEFIKLMFDKHLLLAGQLADTQQRATEWETQAHAMSAEAQRQAKMAAEERNRSTKMEAEMEKRLSEFDIEREQLLGRLQREEMRNSELREELETLEKSAADEPSTVKTEPNKSTKGSAPRSISSSNDAGDTARKDSVVSRKPAMAKPKSSMKTSYGAKGYKSPSSSDKSESSSSSSEDLNSTDSVKLRSPHPKSSQPNSKKPGVTSKPKPSTTNFSKGAGKESKTLSPSPSLDKLSGKGSSSSPGQSSSQKGTKIPSSSAMFANSSQLRKSAPSVAIVAPQPSKASSVSQESNQQQQQQQTKKPSDNAETPNATPQPNKNSISQDVGKQHHPVKKTEELLDLSKPTEPAPKSNLSRPTALMSSDQELKRKNSSEKSSLLHNALASPLEAEPRDKSPRDKSPTRGFGGVNVRAAAAHLTSPVGRKLFGNSQSKGGASSESETDGATPTKEAANSGGNTADNVERTKPVATSPSSVNPGKRNISPRGSPALTRPTLSPSAWDSPLHQAARQGDTAALCKLIEEHHDRASTEKDGSTLIHAAAYGGKVDSLDLLITLGENPDLAQAEGLTPLHVASGEGHEGCVKFLLEHGCNPTPRDCQGWHPIHWAAATGNAACIKPLLDHGATRNCINNIGWTPFHTAARYGQMSCLRVLLYHTPSGEQPDIQILSQINQESLPQPVPPDLLNAMDHDGWTLPHILASTGQKEMLVALHQYGGVHLTIPDRRGRTPQDVATDSCKEFLSSITEGKTVRIIVDVSQSATPSNDLSPHLLGQKDEASQIVIGQLSTQVGMTWALFDQAIGAVLANSCKLPDTDSELPSPSGEHPLVDENSPENIDFGLGVNSIHSYVAGNLHWSVGESPSMLPHEIFSLTSDIVIKLHGNQNGRLDQLTFESFVPLQTLQNYVRLINQYKRVLLYGSPGSGKSRLAVKLANFLQAKNKYDRIDCDMTYVSLNAAFSHKDLCKLLLSKGLLVQSSVGKPHVTNSKAVHILVLDGLDKVGVASLLGDLMPLLESRSEQRYIRLPSLSSTATFTLHERSIIIGTVDRAGPGTDLSVQQLFRWIRIDWDQEPYRSVLPRFLLRRLLHELDGMVPSSDGQTMRVLRWMCGIWRRLNEALAKLSMPEFSTGPKQFFACPINGDAPGSVLRWLCLLWNYSLAPHIEDTFHRAGPPSSSAHLQQQNMAASTALYVLLHRAFLPGCPLSEQEADEYFADFRGISSPALDMIGEKPPGPGVKKTRRSKSLDRSKTSNKAAAMARNQARNQDHLDLINADSQRNGRSMIPRRVTPRSTKPTRQGASTPTNLTSWAQESRISHQRSQSIPSSPSTEEPDLLESLLGSHGNDTLSGIEQLIQLQETLFGTSGKGAGGGAGGGGGGNSKNKAARSNQSSLGAGSPKLGGAGHQKLVRRASDGTPASHNLVRKGKEEDGVWSVWEETV